MTTPQRNIQTKQAPTSVNEAALEVGYKADHGADEDVLGRKAGHIVKPEDRLPIVTDWTGMDDWVNCPPSYEAFFEQYMSYTRAWVRKFGVFRNVEDISQSIMTRYMERDSLGVFTPDWGSKSSNGKSNFRSYYTRFIKTYVGSQRRNDARAAHKHLCIYDAPVGSQDSGDTTTWGDVKAPVVELDTGAVEFEQLVAGLRAKVKNDELVDATLALVMSTDRALRPSDLRKELGINSRAANSALSRIRAALTEQMKVE
jgi:DNA-directed RNA polymerase specialized sigma24 family protein